MVALIALFVALTGSAAAVTVAFAQNSDKVDVPLWKKEVYEGGEEWIGRGS